MKVLAAANPDCVFFYDYCSMPQEPRSEAEQTLFDDGLSEMLDLAWNNKIVAFATSDSYFERSWCLMEFFCHLLSPLDKSIAVMSLDNPAFVAHMLTIIEGEKYLEGNESGPQGWKSRIVAKVESGRTTIPSDKEIVLQIMRKMTLDDTSKIGPSRKGCIDFLTPRGSMVIVAD